MKIAIAGYGLEGEQSYLYYSKDLNNHVVIVDEKEQPDRLLPEGVDTILGLGAFEKLEDFDLVIRTASLNPRKIKTDGKIWSATNEFFSKCPARIIGVTGTKGKGTISSLISAIIEASGKKSWLLGNIGEPSLPALESISTEDIVVYELSSFQLWDIEYSPHVAVISIIEPDHLNIHNDFEDYVRAKANIVAFQNHNDMCTYSPHSEYSRQIALYSTSGKVIAYSNFGETDGAYVKDGNIIYNDITVCSVKKIKLLGQHNIDNTCAAVTVAKFMGIENSDIEEAISGFEGLPHRLEFVRSFNGVNFYNDSFSSSPTATVAAVKSFDSPEVVIIGGVDKGADFSDLVEILNERSNIKTIILIGDIKTKLQSVLEDSGVKSTIRVSEARNMKEIIEEAVSLSTRGDVVLLSPGCASFDMFKNFYDRGDQFREIVNSL